jgi:hypothetical protein
MLPGEQPSTQAGSLSLRASLAIAISKAETPESAAGARSGDMTVHEEGDIARALC